MTFVHNFPSLRIKYLLILAVFLALPACSGGSSTGQSSGSNTSGVDIVSSANGLGISWIAPSEREDVTPISLSEISSYRIYYGTEAGQYLSQMTVDGSASSVQIENLSSGTYYVVMTTVDTDGRESVYSQEVSASL